MAPPPLCAERILSRQVFRDVNFSQRAKSPTRGVHTLAMDGLWRNFEVEKAFETACMHIGLHRTCDRDSHNGNALTIFGRK
jgi:hypothetical protein